MKREGRIKWVITKEMAEQKLKRTISDMEFNSFCNEFEVTYKNQFEGLFSAHASLWEIPTEVELSESTISSDYSIESLLDGVLSYYRQKIPRNETERELELLLEWVMLHNHDSFYEYYELKKKLDQEWLNNN